MVNIKALYIFEIMGKPAEHIKASLNQMIDKLSEQKGMKIVRREVHEPKLVEKKEGDDEKKQKLIDQELFSTFAEVEVETQDINIIMSIVLNMLPAHVEILEPTNLELTNSLLSSLMTELTVKMHKYDEVTKILMLERNELLRKLNEHDRMIGVEMPEDKDKRETNREEDSKK